MCDGHMMEQLHEVSSSAPCQPTWNGTYKERGMIFVTLTQLFISFCQIMDLTHVTNLLRTMVVARQTGGAGAIPNRDSSCIEC